MQIVPAQAIPNQGLQVTLGSQAVALSIFQTDYGLYMSVSSNGSPVVSSVLCHDVDRIVRDSYLGFLGD